MKKLIDEKSFVRIVGDGAISTRDVHAGRLVVVLILDCTTRRDIVDVIRLHDRQNPGDVVSTWARAEWPGKEIVLHLKFIRPTPGEAMILFEQPKHLFLVDSIIQNHACYIQSADNGPRLSSSLNETPRLLLEIPADSLPFDWDDVISRTLFRRFRNSGLSRIDAKAAAKKAIKMSRETFRFPRTL